jgi:hypothetical protein
MSRPFVGSHETMSDSRAPFPVLGSIVSVFLIALGLLMMVFMIAPLLGLVAVSAGILFLLQGLPRMDRQSFPRDEIRGS